jgi:hypothetical protein
LTCSVAASFHLLKDPLRRLGVVTSLRRQVHPNLIGSGLFFLNPRMGQFAQQTGRRQKDAK